MALKPCKECKKEVAEGAKSCPHCGVSNPAPKSIRPLLVVLGGAVLIYAVASSRGKEVATSTRSPQAAVAAPLVTPPSAPRSPWIFDSSTSEMDDKPRVFLAIDAEEEVQNWLKPALPRLIIRCEGNNLEAYLITKTSADIVSGHLDQARVTVRVDSAQATTAYWNESTDNEAFFASSPRRFVRNLKGASRLLIGYTPFNASPVVARFQLADVDSQLDRLPTGCAQ